MASVRGKTTRWLITGLGFLFFNICFLYIFVEIFRLSSGMATFLGAELSTIVRYFINNYWVFKYEEISIKGFINYHIANIGAFSVWLIASNLMIKYGINYIYAGILAVFFSTMFSYYSNFYWIWKRSK
jgi:putative flippase GtrA